MRLPEELREWLMTEQGRVAFSTGEVRAAIFRRHRDAALTEGWVEAVRRVRDFVRRGETKAVREGKVEPWELERHRAKARRLGQASIRAAVLQERRPIALRFQGQRRLFTPLGLPPDPPPELGFKVVSAERAAEVASHPGEPTRKVVGTSPDLPLERKGVEDLELTERARERMGVGAAPVAPATALHPQGRQAASAARRVPAVRRTRIDPRKAKGVLAPGLSPVEGLVARYVAEAPDAVSGARVALRDPTVRANLHLVEYRNKALFRGKPEAMRLWKEAVAEHIAAHPELGFRRVSDVDKARRGAKGRSLTRGSQLLFRAGEVTKADEGPQRVVRQATEERWAEAARGHYRKLVAQGATPEAAIRELREMGLVVVGLDGVPKLRQGPIMEKKFPVALPGEGSPEVTRTLSHARGGGGAGTFSGKGEDLGFGARPSAPRRQNFLSQRGPFVQMGEEKVLLNRAQDIMENLRSRLVVGKEGIELLKGERLEKARELRRLRGLLRFREGQAASLGRVARGTPLRVPVKGAGVAGLLMGLAGLLVEMSGE